MTVELPESRETWVPPACDERIVTYHELNPLEGTSIVRLCHRINADGNTLHKLGTAQTFRNYAYQLIHPDLYTCTHLHDPILSPPWWGVYQGVGRPFNGLPLFLANLSSSFALRCPIFTFRMPPCCFSFTFISLMGRLPTYFPAKREKLDRKRKGAGERNVPSISFHAFRKSSGSVKAMKPNFALSDKRSRTTLHLM